MSSEGRVRNNPGALPTTNKQTKKIVYFYYELRRAEIQVQIAEYKSLYKLEEKSVLKLNI